MMKKKEKIFKDNILQLQIMISNFNKNKVKKKLLLVFLITFQIIFSQQKRADRFFRNSDYINAAKHYKLQLEKDYTKSNIENISISYYNIFEYEEAANYLKELTTGRFNEEDKTYDNKFNFMYYQVQSALGNYELGLDYLKLYKKNINEILNKELAIEIIEENRLKSPDYVINKSNLNSEVSEFGAVKYKDSIYFISDRGKKLFQKKYTWTHKSFLDIFKVAIKTNLDTIGAVTKLPKIVNSKLHEGNFCFSKDGNTMYISRSNFDNKKKVFDSLKSNNIHLYKSIKEDGKWQKLEKLPFNRKGYSFQHPALNKDGSKLYFSSNQPGGYGSYDIYYVNIKDSGYENPINVGNEINTPNREHFPFISDKNNLFFSSNGHLGFGMLDNFVSEFINGKYTAPINLGIPINSKFDDFNLNYYNSKEGFFATNRENKNDDIYNFKQIGEIFLREYINTFEIRDFSTKEFINNVTVILLNKKTKEIYSNTLGSIASFNSNLLAAKYTLKAKAEGYHENFKIFRVLEKQNQKHILYLSKIPPVVVIPPPVIKKPIDPVEKLLVEKGIDKKLKETDPKRFELLTDTNGPPIIEKNGKLYFEMPSIYFDFNMWNIRADSKLVLNELAKKLEKYPTINLRISAYTDSRGTVMYNQVLSEKRAEATRNYLALETYINARRFKFTGYGESQPIVPCEIPSNCTEQEHQFNRRSEFEIIDY